MTEGRKKKKPISERRVALEFVQYVMGGIDDTWPQIKKGFSNAYEGKFVITHEDDAKMSYLMAVIGLSLEYVAELYTPEVAERVTAHVLDAFRKLPSFEHVEAEIVSYRERVRDAVAARNAGSDRHPLEPLAGRLFIKWLGDNARHFRAAGGDAASDALDPQVTALIHPVISSYLGYWTKISESRYLVPAE